MKLISNIERFKVKRLVDGDGKVWIPRLFSKILGLENETHLCMVAEDGNVILQKKDKYIETEYNHMLVKYDGKGKITIPKIIRMELGMTRNSMVSMSLDVDKVCLTKSDSVCIVCKSTKKLLYNNDVVICEYCKNNFVKK